jgi:hypothetical protein
MDKCRYCGLRGLILSTINTDYSCEHCGEWQSAVLNDVWSIVGYEKAQALCGDCLRPDCYHLEQVRGRV